MNYKGHLIGGIVTSTLVAGGSFVYSGDFIIAGVSAITSLIFSLYPDLDVASKPSRYAFLLGIPSILALIYMEYHFEAILGFVFISLPKAFPHRGLVHTLKFGLLASMCWLTIISTFINIEHYYVILSGFIGYTTHLSLDNHIRI